MRYLNQFNLVKCFKKGKNLWLNAMDGDFLGRGVRRALMRRKCWFLRFNEFLGE